MSGERREGLRKDVRKFINKKIEGLRDVNNIAKRNQMSSLEYK